MHNVFFNTNINVDKFKKFIYKKGDIVFNELDEVKYIGLVCTGNITIKTYTYNDKEYEINNITNNGLFGEFMLFSSLAVSCADFSSQSKPSVAPSSVDSCAL